VAKNTAAFVVRIVVAIVAVAVAGAVSLAPH